MIQNLFPVGLNNQPIVNSKFPERNIRGVLSILSGYITFETSGFSAMNVVISSPNGNPRITIEGSGDGKFWSPIQPISLSSVPSNLSAATGTLAFVNTNGVGFYQVAKPAQFIRISQGSTANNSHTTVNVILYNGNVTPKQQDLRIPNNSSWYFVSPEGGIINSEPVRLSSTPVGSFLNALLGINITNAGNTDTEFLIRTNSLIDPSAPTILFRTIIKAGTTRDFNFTPALRTLVNQFFEVVVVNPTPIYVNAQGVIINA